ncbi:MAG: 2-polyprenylphenol 6-hydroxylase [Alphaproteobacteria bacterium]
MLDSLRQFFRLLHIARTLARHDALFPLEQISDAAPVLKALRWLSMFSRRTMRDKSEGERLRLALQSLGPSFIKLGQSLATRPDLLGGDVAEALTALQDRLPPFPSDEARATIEEELEQPIDALFQTFEDEPVAAASIAQVHKAVTSDGIPVAVKVLRPGIEAAFRRDVETFRWLARLLERRVPDARRLRPIDVVETLADSVEIEMDLRYEASAASELAENMAEEPNYRIPRVDWPRTAKRVLATEWIDGTPVNDRQALIDAGHDLDRLARVLVRVFLLQVMRDGFFHADLHQGNLIVAPDGTLVAVDFGIMGRLDKASRRYLAEILRGFHLGDYRRIAEVHFEAGYVPRTKSISQFAQALRAIGEPINGRPVSEISFGRLLSQLFKTTETFDMHTQPQLLMLQRTMVMAEGLALHLDASINMWEVSPPVVTRWIESNMGPDAYLREGLESLQTLARYLPLAAEQLKTRVEAFTDEGVRLHPDSARLIAHEKADKQRLQTAALWVIAGLLAALLFSL